MFKSVPFLFVLFALPALAEDLTVLEKPRPQMLRDALRVQVHAALDRRLAAYEARTNPVDISEWQRDLRAKFVESLGGFPKRTPLNPQIVGKFQADGYRVEKLIYESRPQFFVTAILYLPETQPPYPAVLVPCGHSANGKAAGAYQRISILLAKHGIAALCYDPVGQGERKQILKTNAAGDALPAGEFSATGEHTITGVAPILLGENLASYRIWDGIRSIDYLISRPDIDPDRIGCTGNSGGGMMTSYLVALDDRIKAAAPGCFITTTRIKHERPGPGDAEQNIFAQTAYGLDHADYLMLAAPRAVLICSATQDFVPIEGAWISFRQAKRLYTRLEFPERINLVEADAKHGFSEPLRVAALQWMRRWLLEIDAPATEPAFEIHSDKQLQCTPRGQVLLMDSAKSLNDLYRANAEELAEKRKTWNRESSPDERREKIRELIGCSSWENIFVPKARSVGLLERDGYQIEKLILEPAEGIVLPALLFQPKKAGDNITIFIHGQGKHTEAKPGGQIEELVKQGQRVLAVDVRGYGETESPAWRFSKTYAGSNAAEYFISYMLGQSLVGSRTADILAAVKYCTERFPQSKLHLVGVGRAGIPALHAAALAPQQFHRVRLDQTLDTWNRVIETPVTIDQLENTVHGALRSYDLPDLIPLGGPGKCHMTNPRDAQGQAIR